MRRLLVAFFLIILIMLGGCSNDKQKDKIDVVLDWVPNTNHTGLYVAKELGYFDEEGIDVNIICPPEDASVILVACGKAQFGISSQGALSMAFCREYPLPVTAVSAIMQHNTAGIITKKDKNITSASMLEGKTYASFNGPTELAMLKYIVSKDGGDYNKINVIPNTVTDVVSALNTNVDAMLVYYNYEGVLAKVNNLDINFIAFRDIDECLDYYVPVIISNDNFLKNNPDLARKFLSAVKKGYEYAAKNPQDSADILMRQIPQSDRNFIIESQKYTSYQYIDDAGSWGIIDEDRWNSFYRWLYDNNVIDKKIEDGTGFTNNYLY